MLVAGLGDDLGLAGVELGVEHLVLDAVDARQQRDELLALFDAGGADQHGPADHDVAAGPLIRGPEQVALALAVVPLLQGLVNVARRPGPSCGRCP